MPHLEFLGIISGLLVGLVLVARFAFQPLGNRLQRDCGWSDQAVTELTIALPMAMFVILLAVVGALVTG